MKAYFRNLSTLASGSVFGQVVAAAASPLLSRLFTPEDYGVSGFVLSLVMIFVFVSTLRYEELIVAGRTASSRSGGFAIAFLCLCVVSLVILAAAILLGNRDAPGWLILFAPLILFLSVLQSRILPPLLIQLDRYRSVALGHFTNAALGAGAQIGCGLLGMGAVGLLVGRTVGLFVATILMAGPISRTALVPIARMSRRGRLLRVMRAYRRQAFFLAPAGLFNAIAMQLPFFYITAAFGSASAGAFFFTQSLANAAMMIYRKSVTSLTAKAAHDLRRQRRPVLPFVLRLLALIGAASCLGAVALFLEAEELVPLVFGHRWDEAGIVAKWLGVFYASTAIHLPVAGLATLFKYQHRMLRVQIAQFVAVPLALVLGAWIGGFETTVAAVSLATAGVYCVNVLVMLRLVHRDDLARAAVPRTVGEALGRVGGI
jgi:O-antigen/teichoic acid export membrane protein